MGKYLHKYETVKEFTRVYRDDGGIMTFVCSAGTFTFDAYIDGYYNWKNGNKQLITGQRTPVVGIGSDNNPEIGAYDLSSGSYVEITAVGEKVPGKYNEPWVSLSDGKSIKVTSAVDNEDFWFNYIGEFEDGGKCIQ